MALSALTRRFIPCLNPRRVLNKYTGEYLMVGCGKCYQCLNSKSFVAQKACENEALHHRFCYFVTPSYEECFLPKVKFQEYHSAFDDSIRYRVIDDCVRSDTYLKHIADVSHSELYSIQRSRYNKYKRHHSPVAYALSSDLQKYIKRVRYKVFKETGERIRFYAVSDYGGKYLRPHFHILFYFDKSETFQVFERIVSEAWPFGNVDRSLSAGKASTYVSSYVTGKHLSVPLYQTPKFKTRSFHSKYFGYEALLSYRKTIYGMSSAFFDGAVYRLPHGLATFYGTPTIERTFYPKAFGFYANTRDELRRTYRLYYEVTKGESCSYKEFRERFQQFYRSLSPYLLNKYEYSLGLSLEITERSYTSLHIRPYELKSYTKVYGFNPESRLASIYYTGKRFHHFVCRGDSSRHDAMLDIIIKYYKDKDESKWRKFLEDLEFESLSSCTPVRYAYPLTYLKSDNLFNNFCESLKKTDAFARVENESKFYFDRRVKKKELSDILTNGLI